MVDISYQFKKSKEELSKFQRRLYEKMAERDKLKDEILAARAKAEELKTLDIEMEKKNTQLLHVEMELRRMQSEKMRLLREVPHLEHEIRRIELERKFGKNKGRPIGKDKSI